jgi:TonB family protein
MRTLFLTALSLFLFVKANAQQTAMADTAFTDIKTYMVKRTWFPAVAAKNHVQGTVVLNFKIDNGKITEAHILKSLIPGCDAAALRVFQGYQQTLQLPPGEYTAGVTFLFVDENGESQFPPFDKSSYQNFLFEVAIKHASN